jgi:putative membrane protein insertion efficiency factor
MRRFVILMLVGYKRFVSPLLPSACRFHPTCSEYMREAVEVWGVRRGLWLGLKRLGRCQPFCKGGLDPVPRPPAAGAMDEKSRWISNQAPRDTRG